MPRQSSSIVRPMDEETITGTIEKTIQDLMTRNDIQNHIVSLEEEMERLLVEKTDELKNPWKIEKEAWTVSCPCTKLISKILR